MSDPKPAVPYPNTYWIIPGQYLAGEHPGDLNEDLLIARVSALLEAGIRTFVDLTEDHEMDGYYGHLRNLAEKRRIEITYLRVPIADQGVPSSWTLRCILDVLDRSIVDGHPAFVHCFAGRGRTGTVVGAYLKRHGLAKQGDVVAKLAQLRRLMPCGRESSPQTPEQIRVVENWKEGA